MRRRGHAKVSIDSVAMPRLVSLAKLPASQCGAIRGSSTGTKLLHHDVAIAYTDKETLKLYSRDTCIAIVVVYNEI